MTIENFEKARQLEIKIRDLKVMVHENVQYKILYETTYQNGGGSSGSIRDTDFDFKATIENFIKKIVQEKIDELEKEFDNL